VRDCIVNEYAGRLSEGGRRGHYIFTWRAVTFMSVVNNQFTKLPEQ